VDLSVAIPGIWDSEAEPPTRVCADVSPCSTKGTEGGHHGVAIP
jgi:hypothetical protein